MYIKSVCLMAISQNETEANLNSSAIWMAEKLFGKGCLDNLNLIALIHPPQIWEGANLVVATVERLEWSLHGPYSDGVDLVLEVQCGTGFSLRPQTVGDCFSEIQRGLSRNGHFNEAVVAIQKSRRLADNDWRIYVKVAITAHDGKSVWAQ